MIPVLESLSHGESVRHRWPRPAPTTSCAL